MTTKNDSNISSNAFIKVRTDETAFMPSERWRITKNILFIGFAFMIHFTAFMGTSNLQSSINADGSLGVWTLAAIYGSLIFSNIFLPVLIIRSVFNFTFYWIITNLTRCNRKFSILDTTSQFVPSFIMHSFLLMHF